MTTEEKKLSLLITLFSDEYTIYQFPLDTQLPVNLLQLPWYSISRNDEEISVILPTSNKIFQENPIAGSKEEGGWHAMKIDGVLDFSLVGILAEIVNPLKAVKVPVFVLSTYNTDYILVKGAHLDTARAAIEGAGHVVQSSS